MSQTTSDTPDDGGTVSLSKAGTGSGGPTTPPARGGLFSGGPEIVNVPPPRSIDIACLALLAVIVGMVLRAIGYAIADAGTLRTYYLTTLKSGSPRPTEAAIVSGVHGLRTGGWILALILGLVLLLLTYSLRRTRSASGTRWALLIVMVYLQLPFGVVPGKHLTPVIVGGQMLAGLASIVALIAIFAVAPSRTYFRQCRLALVPPGSEPATGGLGGLFGPRRPRGGAAPSSRTATPARTRPASAKPRAKVRADADSAARGAELARARAKASKSRREG